jgi:hypothetical protein
VADAVSLRDFAKLDRRSQGADERIAGVTDSAAVNFIEARLASCQTRATVEGQQHFNRLSTIADYLEVLASVLTQHRNSAQVAANIAQMVKTIRKHHPLGLATRLSDDLDQQSPPAELIERFMAVGGEEYPRNPFRNPAIRLRNVLDYCGLPECAEANC